MKQNKILDLTSNIWRHQKKWQYVNQKIERIELPKAQKIANVIAVVNIPVPLTFSPATSPMIVALGRKLSMKEKVKLR